MKEMTRQIQAYLDRKVAGLQQDLYASALAGNAELAAQSAQRIACLNEVAVQVQNIYERLLDG